MDKASTIGWVLNARFDLFYYELRDLHKMQSKESPSATVT